uniref:Uncharacterized protein n=2 Tax=unclassified Prevotella TaxID=2638335 RepID=A0AB33JU28_9BACT
MKKKVIYIAPTVEAVRMNIENPLMEWSDQQIDGNDTPDFDYGGEGDEGIPAD